MVVLAAVVVAIWLYLVVGHGRFWLITPRLPPASPPTGSAPWPSVAVVVPARDEEAMLTRTVPALADQDYPGPVTVFVVDDASTDGTARVAAEGGRAGRLPVVVVAGTTRPPGWAGKLWAVRQGIDAACPAGQPAPEFVLLTDADIEHRPETLRRLVAWAVDDRRDLVSLMARLRVETGWERLLIPAFVYFFAQLYPFRRVAAGGRTAAAAGGCILVRTSVLATAGGIDAVRGAVIDDVALAGVVRRHGGRLWLGWADAGVRSIRPYARRADIWAMVTRSAYTQLRHRVLLVVAAVIGLALVYLGPLAAVVGGVVTGSWWAVAGGAAAQLLMIVSYVPVIRYSRLALPWALTLPAAAVLYGAMTVDSARRHRRGGVEWKGRQYQ